MNCPSDADLLQKLKLGDSKAFNHIYNSYWQKMYVHAYKRTGSPEKSEDLLQEIFVQFWLKRKELDINNSIESYLFGMLRNKILMHFRKAYAEAGHQKNYSLDWGQEDYLSEKSIYQKDLLEHIELLIDQLPTQSKNVFKLSRKEFLSNKEIAERLQISLKTVEYHINYALNFLRSNFPDYILGLIFSMWMMPL